MPTFIRLITTALWSAWFFTSGVFMVAISVLVTLVTFPFDKNRRIIHYWGGVWSSLYFWTNPFWRREYIGLSNIDPSKTYVIVANHTSYWDILVLYAMFKPFKFVSKEAIFNMPNIGLQMRLAQYVKIVRGELKSIREMIGTCKKWLNQGSSVLIFAEGTRSEDGEIHPFKDGAFRLAVDCNVPLIPIVIDGTYEVLPKIQTLLKFQSDITVCVMPEVNAADFDRSSGKMRKYVEESMKNKLAEIRAGKDKTRLHELQKMYAIQCTAKKEAEKRKLEAQNQAEIEKKLETEKIEAEKQPAEIEKEPTSKN